MLPPRISALLDRARDGQVVILSGAGLSAESGIPTFRGGEGYWRVGAREYHPQELATHAAFSALPEEVWAWYLYRRGVCHRAEPNAAHRAIAALGEGALVVTQNVDGLHRRAGTPEVMLYEIHGRIDQLRCADECSAERYPIPDGVDRDWAKDRKLGPVERALLVCPRCGARARPHVLWFDESYDEPRYRFQSSLGAAAECALLVVVGTSGATTLPHHMVTQVARRRAPLVVINADPSPFSEVAEELPSGAFWQTTACAAIPPLCEALARGR